MEVDTAQLRRGIELFNEGEYFDAHEELEDVWRNAPAEEKKFVQGLVQVAVGLHHYGRNNREGARSLLARAQRNLQTYPATYAEVNLSLLRESLARAAEILAAGGEVDAQTFKL